MEALAKAKSEAAVSVGTGGTLWQRGARQPQVGRVEPRVSASILSAWMSRSNAAARSPLPRMSTCTEKAKKLRSLQRLAV